VVGEPGINAIADVNSGVHSAGSRQDDDATLAVVAL
jgi:hypothetical protein